MLTSIYAESVYNGLIFVSSILFIVAVLSWLCTTGWSSLPSDFDLLGYALSHYIIVYCIIMMITVLIAVIINIHYFAMKPVIPHQIKHYKHNIKFKHA